MVTDMTVGAELEPTAAGKIALYEGRVVVLKDGERFARARVQVGQQSPYTLGLARFHRLQAEADLIQLKEQMAKAKK